MSTATALIRKGCIRRFVRGLNFEAAVMILCSLSLLLLLQITNTAAFAPKAGVRASTVGLKLNFDIDSEDTLAPASHSWPGHHGLEADRRSFLRSLSVTAGVASLPLQNPSPATAAEEDMIDVFFGCGCFWHVQHEFVEAERNILQRSDDAITSRAGYAGGKVGSLDGKVCYHNAQNIADYGKLGHAEVVAMTIPESKFEEFAIEYCKLFDESGLRPDQFGDRGSEYRNLVGIPGGKASPLAEKLVKASLKTGDKLDFAVGKGDDKDLPKVAFIMDSNDFPFYVAEQYHQFHDGFKLDESYPQRYNDLASKFAKKGENFGTCPNGMMGLGFGGL